VYPEHLPQPFEETMQVGSNRYWGNYGTDKIEAEQELLKRVPGAYILRPPYLYGPMNNVYREAFVFDCAMQDRIFYLPQDGSMKLQFFHIHDLCKCIDSIVRLHPEDHVFNVGDDQIVSIREWVDACYRVAGKEAHYVSVPESVNPREYFSFYNYQYILDVRRQKELLDAPIPLTEGLKSSYEWYRKHPQDVKKMEYLKYIDEHLAEKVEE
jgi:nucleoside-diphosphate-sugar epimerase